MTQGTGISEEGKYIVPLSSCLYSYYICILDCMAGQLNQPFWNITISEVFVYYLYFAIYYKLFLAHSCVASFHFFISSAYLRDQIMPQAHLHNKQAVAQLLPCPTIFNLLIVIVLSLEST